MTIPNLRMQMLRGLWAAHYDAVWQLLRAHQVQAWTLVNYVYGLWLSLASYPCHLWPLPWHGSFKFLLSLTSSVVVPTLLCHKK